MRALTITQPWAAAIAAAAIAPGHKTTENRTWTTRYRGTLLIHAGQRFDHDAVALEHDAHHVWAALAAVLPEAPGALDRGAIIATARLTDCHPADDCCAPWGEQRPGVRHWMLADIRPLPEPVPARGRLGLWIPSPDLVEAVTGVKLERPG
jgi:hypothetical protein